MYDFRGIGKGRSRNRTDYFRRVGAYILEDAICENVLGKTKWEREKMRRVRRTKIVKRKIEERKIKGIRYVAKGLVKALARGHASGGATLTAICIRGDILVCCGRR